ncbi:hypothetical protein DPMN_064455 [Dreissena polymorpha]|uniref:Uncharacterized protein n=1 Tax=Dreissena polymorpha TaxID=45954 RepID=A0A9D4CC92_DREPO|nr:hypothetical protein DPMN_064455 [Dreissena polymorpha]
MGYADAECRVQRMSRFEATKPNRQMKVKSVVLKETLVEITDDSIVEEIQLQNLFPGYLFYLSCFWPCYNIVETRQKKLKS